MTPSQRLARRPFLASLGLAATAGLVSGASAPPGNAAGRAPFRLGLASYTTRKFTLAQTLAMARRVGLEELCLKSFHLPLEADAATMRAAVDQVTASGLHLYSGGVITMRKEAEVEQAFAYAKAAGMGMIIASPQPDMLPAVQAQVRQTGIRVAIHNHGPGDKIYPTPESVCEQVKTLDARIGLCMDVGHTTRIGGDPVKSAERCADRLLDVHIKDVSAAVPEGKETEIGRGVIDIPGLLRKLLRLKYGGVVSFEYEKDPDDPLAGLAESVGYVRGVIATLLA